MPDPSLPAYDYKTDEYKAYVIAVENAVAAGGGDFTAELRTAQQASENYARS